MVRAPFTTLGAVLACRLVGFAGAQPQATVGSALADSVLLREHYKIGPAKSWSINRIEPLPGDPLSGLDCIGIRTLINILTIPLCVTMSRNICINSDTGLQQ